MPSDYIVVQKSESEFIVTNTSNGEEYLVDIAKETCTCKDYLWNVKARKLRTKCKHIKMCLGIINSKDSGEPDFEEEERLEGDENIESTYSEDL